ncbi:MAG: LptA/OstA family protein [Nibricoccus sp.]
MNSPRFRFTALLLLGVLGVFSARAQDAAAPVVPTEITGQKLEMWSNATGTEERAIFTGNVTVTGTDMKLTCDRLEILAERLGDKAATIGTFEKFKSLIAVGKVRIVQGDREANCGRAEVYPREDKIVLYEKPVVIDHSGPWTYTGDYLEMFRGQRRVIGANYKMTGPPMKNLSYDKDSPPPSLPVPTVTPAPAAPQQNTAPKPAGTPQNTNNK